MKEWSFGDPTQLSLLAERLVRYVAGAARDSYNC